MAIIIIIRHGVSTGNENHIIQGRNHKYNLTIKGISDVIKSANENHELLQSCDYFFSSPAERCKETASYIQKTVCHNVPIITTSLIDEMDPGVLGGLSHADAKKLYPEYYAIWTARGDLDGIPSAESGDYLQARAIAFLCSYYNMLNNKISAIITHAGFMRCLINTIYRKARTTPINVTNAKINIIELPEDFINQKLIYSGHKTKIYRFDTIERSFAVKISNRRNPSCIIHIQQILSECGVTPKIYYCDNIEGLASASCVISDFIDGHHFHGELTDAQLLCMFDITKKAHIKLHSLKSFDCEGIIDITKKIKCRLNDSVAPEISNIGNGLLSIYETCNGTDKLYPCLYDLHRDNFIFSTKSKVFLLDTEAVLMASPTFYIACFIASNILLEYSTISKASDFLNKFQFSAKEERRIEIEILIRLFIGLSYYSNYGIIEHTFYRYISSFHMWLKHLYLKSSIALNIRDYFENELDRLMRSERDENNPN